MARAGQIIENPVTGERLVFRGAGPAGSDDAFRAEVFVRPFGRVAAPHVHLDQEERLHVLAGRLRYWIGGQENALTERQTVSFAPGVAHLWWNVGDAEAQVQIELRPARQAEALFERLFALARNGQTDERGVPGLFQLAVLAREHGFYVAGVPLAVQRPILSALGSLARPR